MRLNINILLFGALCYTHILYADSIIFLPDSNKPSKQTQQDNFGDVSKDSDLRLFDIQKKGFNSKDSKGFKALPDDDSSTQMPQDSIKLPQNMQQEDLPRDYSNAFDTSMIESNNIESSPIILAQNTSTTKKATQKEMNIPVVANGATFIAISSKKKPQAIRIQKKEFPWVSHPKDSKKKIAFIAIPYRAKLGILTLNNNLSIQIVQGKYKKEKITITNTSKTKPDKAASEQIAKELAEANAIYRKYTKKRYWSKPFELPLDSVITSPFGSARVFNDEIKSFHGGVDFRAAIGTPIHASNDGVVIIAKERFLAGNSVVIDHGEGIYSMYYHCSEIKVKVGQRVQKGQVIALSGDTGRVSGAHLHFGMLVNGVQIDPIDFINKVNALF